MARVTVTLSLDQDIWRRFKSKCRLLDKKYSHTVEELIKREMKHGKESNR